MHLGEHLASRNCSSMFSFCLEENSSILIERIVIIVFIPVSKTYLFVPDLLRLVSYGKREMCQINCDVFDGKVWKDFLEVSWQQFLSGPCSLALMLNIDWFQPFKHSVYSVGAIYLTVMNLRRSLRFKRENVILVGIIPGPTEPSLDMNTLLNPLVKELLKFWEGVSMDVHKGASIEKALIRCAILCCACDLPAGRKVCGFVGFNATLGCSKCFKNSQEVLVA